MFTPTITSIVDSTGNVPVAVTKGDELTITYDLKSYSGTRQNLEIVIGNAAMINCGSASETSVTCEVGNTAAGDHVIIMKIPEVGDTFSEVTVSVSSEITDSTPTVGSQHGGTVVTVTGTGFGEGDVVNVDIGGVSVSCDSTGFEVTYLKSKLIFKRLA
jgi:hypothetical protein